MAHLANHVPTLEGQVRQIILDSSHGGIRILMTTREFSDIAFGTEVTNDTKDSVSDSELLRLPKDGCRYKMRVNTYLRARVRKHLQHVLQGSEYLVHAAAGPLLLISPIHTTRWLPVRFEVIQLVQLLLQLYRQIEAAFVRCAVKHGLSGMETINEFIAMHANGLVGLERESFVLSKAKAISSRVTETTIAVLETVQNPVSRPIIGRELQEDLKELEGMIAW